VLEGEDLSGNHQPSATVVLNWQAALTKK